jgi:hypothetical protein
LICATGGRWPLAWLSLHFALGVPSPLSDSLNKWPLRAATVFLLAQAVLCKPNLTIPLPPGAPQLMPTRHPATATSVLISPVTCSSPAHATPAPVVPLQEPNAGPPGAAWPLPVAHITQLKCAILADVGYQEGARRGGKKAGVMEAYLSHTETVAGSEDRR